jgi:integrase
MTEVRGRRSYGTATLYVHADRNGREIWYGRWRASGRQLNRALGPKRPRGSREGLTQAQAEKELRRMISATQVKPRSGERLGVEEITARYLAHAKRRGRKPSTRQDIASIERRHLRPFFGERPWMRSSPTTYST